MTFHPPTIVIFDMDGTTVRHINPKLLGMLEWLDDWIFKINHVFKRHKGIEIAEPDKRGKKPRLLAHKAMHKLRSKSVDQIVEPCPGIYSVLSLLKKHNIPMAVASNGLGKGYGHDVLKEFGLDEYFTASVFREDLHKSKPNPEGILLAVDRLNIDITENDNIWYIGDRHKDITAAQAAKDNLPCKVTPIAYGLNAAVAILDKGLSPNHIIMSFQDLYLVFDRLLGPVKNKDAKKKTNDKNQDRDLFANMF